MRNIFILKILTFILSIDVCSSMNENGTKKGNQWLCSQHGTHYPEEEFHAPEVRGWASQISSQKEGWF